MEHQATECSRVLQVLAGPRVFFKTLHEPLDPCGVPGCREPYRPLTAPQLLLVILLKESKYNISFLRFPGS